MGIPSYFRSELEARLGYTAGNYLTDLLDVTAGTVTASKALVADASGNVTTTGTFSAGTLAFTAQQTFRIDQESLRVWDAPATLPVTTGANDDLALVYNTFLTAVPTVESGDSKAATTTRRIGFTFVLPETYTAGDAIVLRLNGGMKTTVSDTSATIDAEVARAAAPTTDICATAATTINSLTAGNKDFTITATNVVPGDILHCRITIAIVDSATGTAVIGQWNLGSSAFLLG